MTTITRSIAEPIRNLDTLSWDDIWLADDNGLIVCWENGRKMRESQPELAAKADNGELPILGWRGGIKPPVKYKKKFGTLNYLAQWQGLRGNDLNIDPESETVIACPASGVTVTFKKHIPDDDETSEEAQPMLL